MGRYSTTIDANGISGPDFPTILANLTADYLAIFGADTYLGADSQDGQWMGVLARGYSDNVNANIAVYFSYSPATAQGVGLSSAVKLNGLGRKVPGSSTALLTIVGQVGRTITNGYATDGTFQWALPATVTIPASGTINVVAVCTTQGSIVVGVGAINGLATQVYGIQSVTNAAVSNPGEPVEDDAVLRLRQAASTELPSQTVFEGIEASIAAVKGVTRVKAYENNTASAQGGTGLAARTCWFIVEGGLPGDIFPAMAVKVPPGMPLAGAQTTTVVSPLGSTRVLSYDVSTGASIGVTLSLTTLTGWSDSTEPIIAQAVTDFINSISGNPTAVGYLDLVVPARLIGTPYYGTFKIAAITIKKNAGGFAAADVALAAGELPVCAVGNVIFT